LLLVNQPLYIDDKEIFYLSLQTLLLLLCTPNLYNSLHMI